MQSQVNSIISKEPTIWVLCPICKGKYTKFMESGLCWDCYIAQQAIQNKKRKGMERVKEILGKNSKPYLEFIFEKFKSSSGNKEVLVICKTFDCSKHNAQGYVPHWATCDDVKRFRR